MTRTRMGLLLGLLLAWGLAVAGCGGGGNSGGVASLGGSATPTTNASGSEGYDLPQALVFTRCMRQHGIDLPDPKPDGGIQVDGAKGPGPDDPKFLAAEQACQQYLPKGGGGRVDSGPQGPAGG